MFFDKRLCHSRAESVLRWSAVTCSVFNLSLPSFGQHGRLEDARGVFGELAADYAKIGFAIEWDKDLVVVAQDSDELAMRDLISESNSVVLEMMSTAFRPGERPMSPLDAHPERMAAWYDQAVGRIYVLPSLAKNPSSSEFRRVAAHELAHLWRDHQEKRIDISEDCSLDQLVVRRLLLEGEAELMADALLNDRVLGHRRDVLLNSVRRWAELGSTEIIYRLGREYMGWAHAHRGWVGVQREFRRPPASSEQMLHPGGKSMDRPVDVDLPEFSAVGLRSLAVTTLGELVVRGLVRKQSDAYLVATGWDGDRIVVLEGEDQHRAVVWRSVWDRALDAEQFESAILKQATANILTRRRGQVVDWVYADDAELLEALRSALAGCPQRELPAGRDATTAKGAEEAWTKIGTIRIVKKSEDGSSTVTYEIGRDRKAIETLSELQRSLRGLFDDGGDRPLTIELPKPARNSDVLEVLEAAMDAGFTSITVSDCYSDG